MTESDNSTPRRSFGFLKWMIGAAGALLLTVIGIFLDRNYHLIENIIRPPESTIQAALRRVQNPQSGQPCTLDCLPRIVRVSEVADRLEVEIENAGLPLQNVSFYIQFSEHAILQTQGAYLGGLGETIQIYYGRGFVKDFQNIDTCTYAEHEGKGFIWATGYGLGTLATTSANASRTRKMIVDEASKPDDCLQRIN